MQGSLGFSLMCQALAAWFTPTRECFNATLTLLRIDCDESLEQRILPIGHKTAPLAPSDVGESALEVITEETKIQLYVDHSLFLYNTTQM